MTMTSLSEINHLTILGVMGLIYLAFKFIPWLIKTKNSELEGKVDSRQYSQERELRETNMRLWVTNQISSSIDKLKEFLRDELEKSEKRYEKKIDDLTKLFERYKEANHGLRDTIAQQQAVVNLCNETLERAELLIKSIEKHG